MGILNFIGGLFRRWRTVEPPAVYQPQPVQRPLVYGTHGRLEIRSLFITVPLYDAGTGAEKQKVVDDPNSAVFFHLGLQDVIADHACQANFQNLNMAATGCTTRTGTWSGCRTRVVCASTPVWVSRRTM